MCLGNWILVWVQLFIPLGPSLLCRPECGEEQQSISHHPSSHYHSISQGIFKENERECDSGASWLNPDHASKPDNVFSLQTVTKQNE